MKGLTKESDWRKKQGYNTRPWFQPNPSPSEDREVSKTRKTYMKKAFEDADFNERLHEIMRVLYDKMENQWSQQKGSTKKNYKIVFEDGDFDDDFDGKFFYYLFI